VGFLTTSQFIGLGSLLLAVVAYVVLYRRWKADPEASRLWERAPVPAPARGPARGKKRRS
jgi:hypothetical protein